MGESHGAGDVVRLVFEEDGTPVSLMAWAAVRELPAIRRLPRGRLHAAVRPERHGGDDGGAVARDVDMRGAPFPGPSGWQCKGISAKRQAENGKKQPAK